MSFFHAKAQPDKKRILLEDFWMLMEYGRKLKGE